MNCYICQSNVFRSRKGKVRDAPALNIYECANCGLVALESQSHITASFYENSGMHGEQPKPMSAWLNETHADDQRRFEALTSMLINKNVLDFGCGAGGFLMKAKTLAASAEGVELERRVREYWEGEILIHADLGRIEDGVCDLITSFHVLEHLMDPRAMLQKLALKLSIDGRMVIEVPSSEDALLTLFNSEEFQKFTYWSQHLFLFNAETLRRLAEQAGLKIVCIYQHQRYPLSNHLHWLSRGLPGGHDKWSFIDSPELSAAYSGALAKMGKCDTLIAHLELA